MGLYASFLAAKGSPYVVGVNLVAREDDRVSLQDYHLHMVMCKVLRGRFPEVKLALHAGELTPELVGGGGGGRGERGAAGYGWVYGVAAGGYVGRNRAGGGDGGCCWWR